MSALLGLVPILTSLVLGLIFLWLGYGSSLSRATGVVVFVVAAYLQFFSPYMVAGILLQAALALTLEIRRRMLG
jgi:hypothetical protein